MEYTEEQKARAVQILKESWSTYNKENDAINSRIADMKKKIANLPDFVEQTERAFEEYTGLTKADKTILGIACALQGIRLVILDLFKDRLGDKEAADKTPFHKEEESNRAGKKYYASIEEILSNPVPFDTVQKERSVRENYNPRLSGFNHRFKTLGHDPYLGFIFGTANIMTSTLTMTEGFFNLQSYHVHTGMVSGPYGTTHPGDKILDRADTPMIFSSIKKRIMEEGKEGWLALLASLWKEWLHLHTDIRTVHSLPIPILSSASPNLAKVLDECGLDYMNIKMFEKEFFLSIFIDFIIRALHKFSYNEKIDGAKELYEVRTKKILLYSNEIATTCSILNVAVRACMGDISAYRHFDFGGATNTLFHVLNDPIKIAEIKSEFLISKQCDYISKL